MKTDNNIMDFTKEEAANLINYIAARTIKSLHQQGLLKKPSALQQAKSSEAFKYLLEKINAPKYDPCRRFRKGDKVEYHPKEGRELFEAKRLLAQTFTVVENEHKEFNRVTVEAQNGDTLSVPFYYLELVTPVEEQEPYSVGGSIDECIIYKNGDYYAEFVNSIDAEKACKLLNAAHRKEQK